MANVLVSNSYLVFAEEVVFFLINLKCGREQHKSTNTYERRGRYTVATKNGYPPNGLDG